MHRINFIHQPRLDGIPARRFRAFFASCVFHGLLLGSLLWLSFVYQAHLPQAKTGSAPGAPVLTLETMVIVSPSPTPKPTPAVGSIPALPAPTVAAVKPPSKPEIKPAPPEATVPVLALQPSKPAPATPAKTQAAIHPPVSHMAIATAQNRPKPIAAAIPSSYAPGPSDLPHPPYPMEARDLRETGVVVMNVQFDAQGNVARAVVAQSSGVPILDSETRSFIRMHWHSTTYAGQTISQPVQYSLENL